MNYISDRKKYLETIIYIETDKGSGSGFIFNTEGYAITCAHVVNGATEIYVRIGTSPDAIQKAQIININLTVDIAIILIEGNNYYSASIGLAEILYPGDEIIILGFPFGSKVADDVSEMSVSFSRGYISSTQIKNGQEQVLLDISAKVGNSGSPVISRETGHVVGILCGSILNSSNRLTEEINYMRHIRYIKDFFED